MRDLAPARSDNEAAVKAEQAVLGSLLVNNDMLPRISFLAPEHYFDPVHGAIFEEAARLINAGEVASPISMRSWSVAQKGMDELGGAPYLLSLCDSAATVYDATSYARMVVDCASRRKIIASAEEAIKLAEAGQDPVSIASTLDVSILSIEAGKPSGSMRFSQTAVVAAERVMEAYKADGRAIGLHTGMTDVDAILRGARRGNFIILAGRPGMGKSAFAASVALTVARSDNPFTADDDTGERDPAGVIIVSLEMSEEEYFLRMASDSAARKGHVITYRDAMSGFIDCADRNEAREEAAIGAWMQEARSMEGLGISIADLPAQSTLERILSEIRRRQASLVERGFPVSLVIIDHIGLISKGKSQDNEASRVGVITSTLKGLAKRMNCVVMGLSQLNRSVENREDKRPMLADLRDSGSIEQDADIVIFPLRPEYYIARDEPKNAQEAGYHEALADWEASMAEWRGIAEIDIAKNRSGPMGRTMVACNIGCNHFSDLARHDRGHH